MRVDLIWFVLLMAACNGSQLGNLQAPSQLTCEYLKNPEVVDVTPRFGWVNSTTASQRAEVQQAYQILAAIHIKFKITETRDERYSAFDILPDFKCFP